MPLILGIVTLSGYSTRSFAESSEEIHDTNPNAVTQLPNLVFQAESKQGTAEQGYLDNQISQVGPWQGRDLQDIPYTITVFSEDLLKNIQATTPDQIYRINPLTQLTRQQRENDQPHVQMRGFPVRSSYRDGVPSDQYNHSTTTEDTERVEILNGLSGFLYGVNNIGGVINYVTKRSTAERLNEITLSSLGNESWNVHGDFGGKFDEAGRLGYRLNIAEQGGDSVIQGEEIKIRFMSLGLDWQPLGNLWLQINGMNRKYEVNGGQAAWSFEEGMPRLNASKIQNDVSWGQSWTYRWYDAERYGANVKWEVNDDVAIRLNYLQSHGTRSVPNARNTITSTQSYDQTLLNVFANGTNAIQSEQEDERSAIYADWKFNTGQIQHKFTTGFQWNDTVQLRPAKGNSIDKIVFTDLSLLQPTNMPLPQLPSIDRGAMTVVRHTRNENIMLGDDMTFNERWSALLGVAYTTVQTKVGAIYKESAITPSVSLIFKPLDQLTTYASYIQALEQGEVAADTYKNAVVVNAGQVFKPLVSEQYEVGVKYAFDQSLLLSAAVFNIEKALQYYDVRDPNMPKYVQDGQQVHKGIELTAIGKLTDHVSMLGGYTWIDAKIKKQKQNVLLEGKRPVDVADQIFKIRMEYTVPEVESLSISGAVNYNASSFGDQMKTDIVPSYILFDLGARYVIDCEKLPMTFRIDLHNVLNKHYWNGNGGSTLGAPRTLTVSSSFKF
ncbi:MAG: TonB-dependent siderophore receptor [Acinetobacter sp.]